MADSCSSVGAYNPTIRNRDCRNPSLPGESLRSRDCFISSTIVASSTDIQWGSTGSQLLPEGGQAESPSHSPLFPANIRDAMSPPLHLKNYKFGKDVSASRDGSLPPVTTASPLAGEGKQTESSDPVKREALLSGRKPSMGYPPREGGLESDDTQAAAQKSASRRESRRVTIHASDFPEHPRKHSAAR